MTGFRTLDQADVTGKRVLLRVDLNVPLGDGEVADATRIERMAPTILEIADKGGKVILLSHFGRPKGRSGKDSLKPVAAEVAHIIKRPVAFAAKVLATTASTGNTSSRPLLFAWAMISCAVGRRSCSHSDFPTECPHAARKVFAMPPPMTRVSTFASRLPSRSSLVDT